MEHSDEPCTVPKTKVWNCRLRGCVRSTTLSSVSRRGRGLPRFLARTGAQPLLKISTTRGPLNVAFSSSNTRQTRSKVPPALDKPCESTCSIRSSLPDPMTTAAALLPSKLHGTRMASPATRNCLFMYRADHRQPENASVRTVEIQSTVRFANGI
jgi:hypothetical protein